MATDADHAATRLRLLDAAGAVFAEAGYDKAHVRDICARARANVAAIKYHFGGKYPLYEAAMSWCFDREQQLAREHDSAAPPADPETALYAFVHTFVARLLDPSKPAWHAKLMAREMVEPTGALDRMVEQSVKPIVAHLRAIVRQLVGPGFPNVVVERGMLSVISQCVFYVHSRPVLERVFPKHVDKPDITAIADHIAVFSLAGLRAACGETRLPKKAKPRR